jgi:hypothetical protein
MREVSDVHRHSTTNERPIDLFEREEVAALRTFPQLPPFHSERQLIRMVHHDAHISVDQNRYSVPWMYIGEQVHVNVTQDTVSIYSGGNELAQHARASANRVTVSDVSHLDGILRKPVRDVFQKPGSESGSIYRSPQDYDVFSGGSW